MTYKGFVRQAIISDCEKSVRKFLNRDSYIEYSEITELDMNKMIYTVKIEVHEVGSWINRTYYIGGAFDDYANLYASVIWDKDKKNILWMFDKNTREKLNIPENIEL